MNRISILELDGEMVSMDGRPDKMLMFRCPACNNGHSILVNFALPPIYESGAVWKMTGEFPMITVRPQQPVPSSAPSISVEPSINCDLKENTCRFHGWVRDGIVEW